MLGKVGGRGCTLTGPRYFSQDNLKLTTQPLPARRGKEKWPGNVRESGKHRILLFSHILENTCT